jgi:hypothetical protein
MSYFDTILSANSQLAGVMQQNPNLIYLIVAQVIMKLVFYPWALYFAASRKQKIWFAVMFICMLFLNDFGLLPILYIIITRRMEKKLAQKPIIRAKSKKK